jgi:hypothetical protein
MRQEYSRLPSVLRFFAVCDNAVFFWRTSGNPTNERILMEEELVTAVASTAAEHREVSRECDGIVAIATPTYIDVHLG